MNLLAIGTDVRMSEKGKQTYFNDGSNPHKEVGKVVKNNQMYDHIYLVLWANGRYNSYRRGEIIPVTITVTQEELDSLL